MKNSIRSIQEANLGRRMIAMIMDGVLFAFVWVALALWVFTPIANAAFHYSDLGVTGLKYEVFSKLYVCEEIDVDNKTTKVIDVNKFESATSGNELQYTPLYNYNSEDLNFYKDRLHYYYCCYKTGENIEYPEGKNPEDYKCPNYRQLIRDKDGKDVLPKDYYTEAWFSEYIKDKTTVKDFKNLSYESVTDLREMPFFEELNGKISGCQLFIALPAFGISYLGFYLLVPLLYKNGETFGKKVMKIGLVSKDCFTVKKRQIVFRQLLLLVWVSLSLFVIGIGLTSIATLGVGVFIYLIATVISKTKRSPIDYAAYTYMINTNKSVWFADAEEEEKKETELEEKMSKYQRYDPNEKNLIQIGTEIVNEDVKRELEEEKKKKIKK
ncbi:MAG: RDD family protein [Firmicutes bacterium]|nr:RDD family protein [Candidatus Fiminaster equi]